MKEQSDMCGQIEDIRFTFEHNDPVFAYRLKFCAECGSRIREYIVTSTKSADNSK